MGNGRIRSGLWIICIIFTQRRRRLFSISLSTNDAHTFGEFLFGFSILFCCVRASHGIRCRCVNCHVRHSSSFIGANKLSPISNHPKWENNDGKRKNKNNCKCVVVGCVLMRWLASYVEMGDSDLINDARNGKQNLRKRKCVHRHRNRNEIEWRRGGGQKGKSVTKQSHCGFGHNFCPRKQRNSEFAIASSVRRSLFYNFSFAFSAYSTQKRKSDGVCARAMLTWSQKNKTMRSTKLNRHPNRRAGTLTHTQRRTRRRRKKNENREKRPNESFCIENGGVFAESLVDWLFIFFLANIVGTYTSVRVCGESTLFAR